MALPGDVRAACDITFDVRPNATVGSLTFAVDYTGADGGFRGSDTATECVDLVSVAQFFAVDGDAGFMTISLQPIGGFSSPRDVARCVFDPNPGASNPFASDFAFPSTIILGTNFLPIASNEPVGISHISCSAGATTTTSTTLPPVGDCGDPGGGGIAASDALFALQAAVGARVCALCLCDVNGDGIVSATDALTILRIAVGQPLPLQCPVCL